MKSVKKNIAIIHFQPIELYPPVINFINFIQEESNYDLINIYTSSNENNLPEFQVSNKKFKINRIDIPKHKKFLGALGYIKFFLYVTYKLIVNRPEKILYYETISSFPVYLFSLFNKKAQIFIHFHEYESEDDYRKGMKLTRIEHFFEKKYLFPSARWISQTNKDRLFLFEKDNNNINLHNNQVLPNYPPQNWKIDKLDNRQQGNTKPIKIIYVGALSIHNMFLKEVCEWVISLNGQIIFDIYSNNVRQDTKLFLENLKSKHICLKNGVPYDKLPAIILKYQIGLILYNDENFNWKYNAPNKLFEYHLRGLDVWFPPNMLGCLPYVTKETYPKIKPINFEEMNKLDLNTLLNNQNLKFKIGNFTCEEVFKYLGSFYEKENTNSKLNQELPS